MFVGDDELDAVEAAFAQSDEEVLPRLSASAGRSARCRADSSAGASAESSQDFTSVWNASRYIPVSVAAGITSSLRSERFATCSKSVSTVLNGSTFARCGLALAATGTRVRQYHLRVDWVLDPERPVLVEGRPREERRGAAQVRLVQALAGPAVASCPERASRTGGTLVVDAFFMGAADNPLGHDNRLDSGLGDERQHFFRHPDIIADVGLVLRKPASKVGCLGVLARQNADRELGRPCIVRAIERDRCERPAPESSLGPLCSISCVRARSSAPSAAVKITHCLFPLGAEPVGDCFSFAIRSASRGKLIRE